MTSTVDRLSRDGRLPCLNRSAGEGTVAVQERDLHPIVRDGIYKIAAEALRNAYATPRGDSWWSRLFASRIAARSRGDVS